MKIVVASALLVLMTCTLSAEELSIGKCLDIAAGLDALDHYNDPVTGNSRQYRLGAMRGRIGLNMAALRHVTDVVNKARDGLIAEIGAGKAPQSFDAVERARYSDEYRKVLEMPCDVKPGHIKIDDLHLGDGPEDNAIAPSVIAALAPILD